MRISDWSSDVCSSDLDVQVFGARDYAMRVWIDPGRAAELNLTAGDIVTALRAQNVQVAEGVVGQPPFDTGAAHQLNVETQGRFKTAAERSEEHTSELQSLMRISYAVFCLKKKTITTKKTCNN